MLCAGRWTDEPQGHGQTMSAPTSEVISIEEHPIHADQDLGSIASVSYTHLTLPTIYSV